MNNIFNLIDAAKVHLSNIDLANSIIKTYQERSFDQIIRRYEEKGNYTYNQVIMEKLFDDAEQPWSVSSRSQRLAAIRRFYRYAAERNPSVMSCYQKISLIPVKKKMAMKLNPFLNPHWKPSSPSQISKYFDRSTSTLNNICGSAAVCLLINKLHWDSQMLCLQGQDGCTLSFSPAGKQSGRSAFPSGRVVFISGIAVSYCFYVFVFGASAASFPGLARP